MDRIFWKNVPFDEWKWKLISPKEVACHGDGSVLIDNVALDALEALLKAVGKKVILSAYRTEEYNRRVGGAKHSQHLLGRAFDIACPFGPQQKELQFQAKLAGFKGFGHYRTFLHCDVGPVREWWTGVPKDEDTA